MKFGLDFKVRVILISFVLVMLIFVGFFVDASLQRFFLNKQMDLMIQQGLSFTEQIEDVERLCQPPHDINVISQLIEAELMIIGSDEQVLVCSEQAFYKPGDFIDDRNLQHVLRGEIYTHHGNFFGSMEQWIVVAVPIKQQETVRGVLLLSKSVDSYLEFVKGWRSIILFVGALAVLFTVIIAPLISSRFIQPLSRIREAAQKMLLGDFATRVNVDRRDEIGDLAKGINALAQELERSIGQLSHEKNKLISIIESMDEGILTFTRDRKVNLINQQAISFLGRQQGFLAALKKDENQLIKELVEEAMKKERLVDKEMVINGLVLALKSNPLKDQNTGELTGAVVVIQDVTEKRRVEQMRKDFLASVSHEIRTPLSIMQGYVEALIDGMAENKEEEKDYFQIIQDEVLRLRILVDDLLDLNKIETSDFSLHKGQYSITALVERNQNKYAHFAGERDITIDLMIQPNMPMVFGDERRMEQAVINLLENALRHTPLGGKIVISCYQEGDMAVVQIADNGGGIPEGDLPFIWDRFFKVDKARSREKAGLGLGLSIVKSIVESHGGKVTVQSIQGQGSVFKIKVPLK